MKRLSVILRLQSSGYIPESVDSISKGTVADIDILESVARIGKSGVKGGDFLPLLSSKVEYPNLFGLVEPVY